MKSPRATQPPAIQLSLSDPERLQWDMQQVQLAIARRAYELFEMRGGEHGHDWEDWFRAESELLRPLPLTISETDDRIRIRANVLGFEKDELRISVAPRRVAILGKKTISEPEMEGARNVYIDWYPDQILRLIDLPTEVNPGAASVKLHAGLLNLELPKSAKRTSRSAPLAA